LDALESDFPDDLESEDLESDEPESEDLESEELESDPEPEPDSDDDSLLAFSEALLFLALP